MFDYDVILGMDFMGKYKTNIKCRSCRVMFNPLGASKFVYEGESSKQSKTMISKIKARKFLAKGCIRYFDSILDKDKEEKLKPKVVYHLGVH